MSVRLNQHVGVDLLVFKKEVICHLIDRCRTWHAACILQGDDDNHGKKTAFRLVEALFTTWITIYGPMEVLYVDGESGISSQESQPRLKRESIKLEVRTPGQHVQYFEHRGAILRHTMHVEEEYCKKEGLTVSAQMLLAMCVFCGNALVSTGGTTPYQAVFGRQPPMLPPLLGPETSAETGETPGGRSQRRLREIAFESSVQATVRARTGRTMNTKTNRDDTDIYQVGDLVDIYRDDGLKDETDWHAPVRVEENKPGAGQVVLDIDGRSRPHRY